MKIKKIEIENFRCLKQEIVSFNDYTCLVGPNGGGKSTVLNALNVFFRETKAGSTNLITLTKEDFYERDTSKPIKITVTFGELSDAAKGEFKDYFRQDLLVVSAVAAWSEVAQAAAVTQHGSRSGMKDFASFFRNEGDGKPVAELKALYAEIRKTFPELPAPGTKQAMIDALRAYETAHPEKCTLMLSSDEFYGVSRGAHKLGKYIQWVFIPAIKDASSEQIEAKDTALGRLIERTVRAKVKFGEKLKEIQKRAHDDYDKLLIENQPLLDNLSASLKNRLCEWAHPQAQLNVRWDKDPKRSVQIDEPYAKIFAGDHHFLGEIPRLGHGLQRSYMFALLSELASSDIADAPRLLLGIEEPELFQHPPQAQHLADVLSKLSTQNAQVFACSHSPYFVSGRGFEDVRLVRRTNEGKLRASELTFAKLSDYLVTKLGEARYKKPEGVRAKINQALQPALREMFFAPKIALVEGLEDVAYLTAALNLLGKWEEWRATGCHIVPVGGKSELVQPLAIAQILKIPVFVMYDADGHFTKPEHKALHQADNERLLKLLGGDSANLFPAAPVFQATYIIWPGNLGNQIEGDFVSEELVAWKNEAALGHGQPGGLEKNAMFIATVLEKAWASKKTSKTLEHTLHVLLAFAKM